MRVVGQRPAISAESKLLLCLQGNLLKVDLCGAASPYAVARMQEAVKERSPPPPPLQQPKWLPADQTPISQYPLRNLCAGCRDTAALC